PLPPRGHRRGADDRERPRPRGGGRRLGQPRRGRLTPRLPERAACGRPRKGRAGRPRMSISWTPSGAARRALAVLVLPVLRLLLTGLVAPPAAAPVASADHRVTGALTGIEPAILTPGEDLVVRGTVTNDSPAALELPELRLRAQQSTPISRSLLERWLDPTFRSTTTLLHAERLEDPVEPGSTVSFTLT